MSVSYLLTLYNKEAYIGRVMDAVFAEHSETGGEIVIYDDASTDRSPWIVEERIASYLAQSGTVRFIRGDINRGVAFATNQVINAATQLYTRLVDADDLLVKGSTTQLIRFLKQHDLSFIHGRVTEQGDNDENLETQTYGECFVIHDPLRQILRRGFAGTTSSLFNTADLRNTVPLPEWKRRTQDFLIILRLAGLGKRMGYINDIVAVGPPVSRTDIHLSASLAAMFAEMCRDVAQEAGVLPPADLRYASRRYAARTAKYFRRRGESKLSPTEKFDLWRWKNFAYLAPRQTCIKRLNRTAELLDRDRHVVVLG